MNEIYYDFPDYTIVDVLTWFVGDYVYNRITYIKDKQKYSKEVKTRWR